MAETSDCYDLLGHEEQMAETADYELVMLGHGEQWLRLPIATTFLDMRNRWLRLLTISWLCWDIGSDG